MNAQLIQCYHCKRLFAPAGGGKANLLCYKCVWEYDDLCKKVQKYQRGNPQATLDQVVYAFEIPESMLTLIMRDRRFRFDSE